MVHIMLEELGFRQGQSLFLDTKSLALEQLPLISRVLNLSLEWDKALSLHGPDGTVVSVVGKGETQEAITPLREDSIPWNFKRIDQDSLRSMVRDLLPCEEGEGYLNPSPWERTLSGRSVKLAPGEVGPGKVQEELEMTEIVQTGFYNAFFHHLNPLYISSIGLRSSISIRTFMVSIQGSSSSYTLFSNRSFAVEFENGRARIDGGALVKRSTTWREAKPHRMVWDAVNQIIDLDCRPKYKVSLLRIEPSSVVPLRLRYENGKVKIDLLNLDDKPVVSTLYLPARITSAFVTDPRDMSGESIDPEFDRVKVPMRRWGLLSVSLEVKRLLEALLKKKIISA
ncbi:MULTISPECIES: hypothetical protein [Metallosphaera]|uniref:hypothetical protein n=2 Tax=Sulfolobaceae TaxID=118883 RepID=UPI001F06B8C9|nr:hypothetical protein [Metallosphaera sedula]MCH1771331.1 hypothetical protein [Metallosphaera sedula]MCP6729721.1 hypothetical protein [Metallosphaera sedula]